MTATKLGSDRRFYRDADRAMLGGVCAGLAGYLDLNLKVTRILAFIAFLMAMPVAVIAYIAAVFLIPAASSREFSDATEKHHKKSCWRREKHREKQDREDVAMPKSSVAQDINKRCQSMDERLARLEKHVTSKRFQIDQELSRL